MFRSGLFLGLLFGFLAGCDPVTVAVVSGTSLVYTDKTPLGHAAGSFYNTDCSIVRLEQGEPYCQYPHTKQGRQHAPVYCYPSLGEITCFRTPEEEGTLEEGSFERRALGGGL